MAIITIYHCGAYTGGATNALDYIDGNRLVDGDRALVITSGRVYTFHQLDADSGAAESSPDTIAPDTNAGDKRWIKCTIS